jgi:hypothetical protein
MMNLLRQLLTLTDVLEVKRHDTHFNGWPQVVIEMIALRNMRLILIQRVRQ